MQQITIISDTDNNIIASIAQLLGDNHIDIREIGSRQLPSGVFVTLMVDKVDIALQTLTDAGFNPISDHCVLIRVHDEPGALARVSRRLSEQSIAIRSLNLIFQKADEAVVAVSTNNDEKTREIFSDVLVN
jgi:hypothetical protein